MVGVHEQTGVFAVLALAEVFDLNVFNGDGGDVAVFL